VDREVYWKAGPEG